MLRRRKLVGAIVVLFGLLGLFGCGGQPGPDLSSDGQLGKDLAESSGCVACHGSNGNGGVGPPWVGLFESEVMLEDGSTVIADASYIKRAIGDPEADHVSGYTVKMPQNQLTDDEIQLVLTYIMELG